MTYQETVDYLYARLPMFSHMGAAAYKKDLDNIIQLCAALDNPQHTFKTIHIAGTNGKGSTSHMLAAILQTAGYKTGLYTSPHLKDFRERFRVNGVMVDKPFVVDFTERIKPLLEAISPSFFEITVALAFDLFARQQVEIAVIEVGMGGRLDSTNIIVPELSVITNIGWDHMNILGNTLEAIAGEKAGIIKPHIPVVVGEAIPAVKEIFLQTAGSQNAPVVFAGEQWKVLSSAYQPPQLTVEVKENGSNTIKSYQLDLPGHYQTKNLITVLEAVKQLQLSGWKITEADLQQALPHVKALTGLHGRWEIISQRPAVILDVGHNEDGIREIVSQLGITPYRELHIVIGLVKDKDISKVLALLPVKAHYYFTRAAIPRALPEEELAEHAKAYGLSGETFPDVKSAYTTALAKARTDDLVLVCGSVFIVGEALK